MSNKHNATASREEEIAFLIIEKCLDVNIFLADAGGGNSKPDGFWFTDNPNLSQNIVEVTSPPDDELLKCWAELNRKGEVLSEPDPESAHKTDPTPAYIGQLGRYINNLLREDWALENIEKLLSEPAGERHLFLFGRSFRIQEYFYRLSTESKDKPGEHIEDLENIENINSIWFLGQSFRVNEFEFHTRVARFEFGSGWHRYTVTLDERQLPQLNSGSFNDRIEASLRVPKIRTI